MTAASNNSSPVVLELESVSKVYNRGKTKTHAVNGISLSVHAGEIYGFLGPNGAGKSTTIRMALGLIAPSEGSVRLFGCDLSNDRKPLSRVGSLADGGCFYPHLTGRDNLRILAKTIGLKGAPIDELLAIVDLTAGAQQKVKEFSLGMKQRLGVAAALLNDPDLVILDEPTNGLDAAGIRDMRALIWNLAAQGKAVFLSSHLLHEVQQVCDRVAIVAKGRLLREAAIGELLGSGSILTLDVTPVDQAVTLLASQWKSSIVAGRIEAEANRDDIPAIVKLLVEAGIQIFGVTPGDANLESIFLEMTGDEGA